MTDFEKVYFRSKAVGKLSSQNLKDLKNTLIEIERGKDKLNSEIADNRKNLKLQTSKLSKINWFPIKFLFKERIQEINSLIQSLNEEHNDLKTRLAKHQLGLEITIPDKLDAIFTTLCDDFSELSSVQKIWDLTTSRRTDQYRERTAATETIERELVRFSRQQNSKILSEYQSLHLENANGHDMDIYPQFVLIDDGYEFALVDLADLTIEFSTCRFFEDEGVPKDSKIVGKTWLKCNKDGSRDKRFVDNYEIPIVQYGELHIKSSSGINEVYMFSNPEPALAFKNRFDEYKLALSKE